MIRKSDVARLRARLGLTQEKFARKLGVSVWAVAKWEQGLHEPTGRCLRTLERLAKLSRMKITLLIILALTLSACGPRSTAFMSGFLRGTARQQQGQAYAPAPSYYQRLSDSPYMQALRLERELNGIRCTSTQVGNTTQTRCY